MRLAILGGADAGPVGIPASPAGPWRAVLDLAGRHAALRPRDHRAARLGSGPPVQRAPVPAVVPGDGSRGQRRPRDRRLCRDDQRPPRARFADWPVPQRGQPRTADDSFPRRPAAGGPRRPRARRRWWAAGTRPSSPTSGRALGCSSFRNGPSGLEGTMISNTGDYGHFAGTGHRRQLRAGALRRLVRLPPDRRAPRRHAARRVPRRAADADPLDRREEHGRAASQGADRDHHGGHQRRRSGSRFRISTVGS